MVLLSRPPGGTCRIELKAYAHASAQYTCLGNPTCRGVVSHFLGDHACPPSPSVVESPGKSGATTLSGPGRVNAKSETIPTVAGRKGVRKRKLKVLKRGPRFVGLSAGMKRLRAELSPCIVYVNIQVVEAASMWSLQAKAWRGPEKPLVDHWIMQAFVSPR